MTELLGHHKLRSSKCPILHHSSACGVSVKWSEKTGGETSTDAASNRLGVGRID